MAGGSSDEKRKEKASTGSKKGKKEEETKASAVEKEADAMQKTELDDVKKTEGVPAVASKGKKKKKSGWKSALGVGGAAETVPLLILGYVVYVGKGFYANLYPVFPDFDGNHNYIPKYGNIIDVGEELEARLYVKESKSQPVHSRDAVPVWTLKMTYDWEKFVTKTSSVTANVSQPLLTSGKNVWLTARLFNKKGERIAEAHGKMVKYKNQKPVPTKYWLLSSDVCDEGGEKTYGTKSKPQIARGIPKMQVRLVYDRTLYPAPWKRGPYVPHMYVDEFWLTDDQLVKFNTTGTNQFGVDMHFSLMSDARWRFQAMMEQSFAQNAKVFGEDSEDLMSMRDLFANTHPYLLLATMLVSVLHTIFEYLALKNDVSFWNSTSPEVLRKFVSLRAVMFEILCNVVLLIYLWDQDTNFLVVILSVGQVLVDCWKLTRVIEVRLTRRYGIVPWLTFRSRVPTTGEDYDKVAMKYLSIILVPVIISYAGYSALYECHKSWGSYVLHVSATMVYALGFALMTPQLFINYQRKSVAHLPWRRFIYRAINTFIDDLFSFIIKMPTMHRMSCFRDDIVFVVYLYQRRIYPEDRSRLFDEDDGPGEEQEEVADGDSKKTK
eukprot:TRINITY_DN56428_c0_g1_i1.p1 TRINITY_DN56428_c0_g1~~TRINITY_DN56428_c0_g1_i1.p1  ORF type:complete len:627 (+),score=131.67 TRINITY_DN56428_c0_g1_i1:61-1881(+)